MRNGKGYKEEDELHDSAAHLLEHRVPWLFLGLVGGMIAVVVVSKFEEILSADIRLAFFIPVIVYLSDAVGTQSETIFVRAISKRKIGFTPYIIKESAIGLGLGIIFGLVLGAFAALWLASYRIGLTLGLTMLVNLTLAPILAIVIPSILYRRHADPALGAGPVATILQDLISLFVYFLVASIILF